MSDDQEFIPVKAPIPWGKAVRITIPEPFYSDDWRNGVRAKTYLGHICAHSEGGICLQPQDPEANKTPPCVPIENFDLCEVSVLKGKLKEYL